MLRLDPNGFLNLVEVGIIHPVIKLFLREPLSLGFLYFPPIFMTMFVSKYGIVSWDAINFIEDPTVFCVLSFFLNCLFGSIS